MQKMGLFHRLHLKLYSLYWEVFKNKHYLFLQDDEFGGVKACCSGEEARKEVLHVHPDWWFCHIWFHKNCPLCHGKKGGPHA